MLSGIQTVAHRESPSLWQVYRQEVTDLGLFTKGRRSQICPRCLTHRQKHGGAALVLFGQIILDFVAYLPNSPLLCHLCLWRVNNETFKMQMKESNNRLTVSL